MKALKRKTPLAQVSRIAGALALNSLNPAGAEKECPGC